MQTNGNAIGDDQFCKKHISKEKQPEVLLFFTIMLFAKQSCPDLVDPISKVTWTLGERASLS